MTTPARMKFYLLRAYYEINRETWPMSRRAAFLDAWRLWRKTRGREVEP